MTLQEDLDAFLAMSDDDLDALMAEAPDGEAPAPPPIPDDGAEALVQADRYLRGLRRVDEQEAELKAVADAERRRIQAWLEDKTASTQRRRGQLTALLESFTRAWKARNHRNPPPLPSGALRLSAPRVSVLVNNEAAFRDWAEGNQRLDLLRIKVEADKDAIKRVTKEGPEVAVDAADSKKRYRAAVTAEGEQIPGVVLVTPEEDNFTVKTETREETR